MLERFQAIFILLIVYSCYTSDLSFKYISFHDTKYESDLKSPEEVIVYSNRLDIDSKYEEMGVLIVNNGINGEKIQKIKLEAFNKNADGFLIEGKNIVLIKIVKEVEDEEKTDYGI